MIREIELAAPKFGFEGMKKGSEDQPPVFRPDGTEYDLNDPDFPVVKSRDHKFKYKYWEIIRSGPALLKYLEEHYDYFNKTRFQGKLVRPKIALLKDVSATKMRLRGRWSPRQRILAISPNLFNAPHEGWVNRVLIHEMCHQWVTDIHGPEADRREWKQGKGHGPLWQGAMIMAKIPPLRYDYEINDTYMDEEEKFQKHVQQERWKAFGPRMFKPYSGAIAGFFNKKKEPQVGVVAGRSKLQKQKWCIITEPKVFSMEQIDPDNMFVTADGENLAKFHNFSKQYMETVDKLVSSGVVEKVNKT